VTMNKPYSVWTPLDDAKLAATREETSALQRHRDLVYKNIRDDLDKHIDKNVAYHELTLSQLAGWIMEHKWILVDILTQGEFARLLANQPVEVFHVHFGEQ
jgi:uncharacterized protein YegJ (DUF2314 family)